MEDENAQRLTIGYLTPFILGELSLSIIKGVQEKADELDINLVCLVGQRFEDTSKEFIKQANIVYDLVDKEYIKGSVIWSSQITKELSEQKTKDFYNKLKDIPLVGISMPIKGYPNISTDDTESMKAIIEHLVVEHKYTKIGFVCANKGNYICEKRLNAYKENLKYFGLKYRDELVSKYNELSINGGKKGTKQLFIERALEPVKDIEAIVAPNDIIAVGVSEQLRQLGIRCPEEIAVVGFDNTKESKISKPSLTTVNQSYPKQGYEAVSLLIDIIKGNTTQNNVSIPGRLIIRNSCGCKETNLSELNIDNSNTSFKMADGKLVETITDIQKNIVPFYYTIEPSWVENLAESFLYDMQNNGSERFISTLNVYLDIISSHNEDISNFQNIITLLRNKISPLIQNYKSLLKATDIWNKARITITDASELVAFNKLTKDEETLYSIYSTEQRLMPTFALKEFLDTIENILKDMKIKSCYIAIYDKQEDILKKSKLIFAYNEKGRIIVAKDYYFNPKEIVPKEFKPIDRRYTYIVNALYYKNIQLGFVVYETDVIDRFVFDTLSGQISSALYRIKMFKRLKESENDREHLFDKLQAKNLELEKKIEERTSAIHNVNKELQTALSKVNIANEAKSRFLANLSHEIRNPLNCIIGFAEILENAEDPILYKKYISLIYQESEKLLSLLNGVLDISKIESGKIVLNKEVFNLHSCISSVNSTYSAIAGSKGLYYHIYGLDILPEFVIGDSLKLKQILSNILNNAVKFTENGGITISLEVAEEDKNSLKILFNINDTGIGIASNKQKSIFENYIQATYDTSYKYGGTGLGMAISKQLVELMNGTIGVDSVENEGSTFWFAVYFDKVKPHYLKDSKQNKSNKDNEILVEGLKNYTILLVEDYIVNIELAKIHLQKLGCKIIEANDGRTAINLFKKNKIDLIIIDIQIGEIDGCSVTKIIRETDKGKDIPIIAMTANAFENDIKRYFECGISDIIVKPFRQEDLRYKVILWLNRVKSGDFIENDISDKSFSIENNKTEQYIDVELNLQQLDGDIKFFRRISTEFLKKAENQLDLIKKAISNKDYDKLTSEIHAIKGAALNLSAKPLAEICKAIEQKGKNKDLTEMNDLIKTLEMIIIKTQSYLNSKIN